MVEYKSPTRSLRHNKDIKEQAFHEYSGSWFAGLEHGTGSMITTEISDDYEFEEYKEKVHGQGQEDQETGVVDPLELYADGNQMKIEEY